MKNIVFFMVFIFSSAVTGITINVPSNQASTVRSNLVTTQFGLKGVITRYSSSESKISIAGKKFTLSAKGDLTNGALKSGLRIRYNVEHSPTEKLGRVTKVWLDE